MSHSIATPEWRKWLKARCHEVGWDLGCLTGQDNRTLGVVAALWELYFGADEAGQACVLRAMRELLSAMQPSAHGFARELIARSGEWGDRDRVWALVVGHQHEVRP